MKSAVLERSSPFRVLATYAVACFVVLQLLDIVLEPLGVPLSTIRWVMLAMIATAPLLFIVVVLRDRRRSMVSAPTPGEAGPDAVFVIGHAELDTAQRQLRFNGTPVDIQPKVFDLIEYLVRARDRVVSKDELFDEIWPAVVVSESSLTQSIKRARDVFRRNGFEQDVIRTVSRKGYQFDFAVNATGLAAPARRPIWTGLVLPTVAISLLAVLLGALVWNSGGTSTPPQRMAVTGQSVVVLPFADMTPDQDFAHFSAGLTDTLTSSLTTVRNLRVIAQGSASRYDVGQTAYAEIGDELGVAYIVEGAVQRELDELRVSARLIRASDGQQLWSSIYNRSFDKLFDLQDDISRAIVDQLSLRMPDRLSLPARQSDDGNGENVAAAYRLLLLGQEERRNGSADGLRSAEVYFREALALRPRYAEASLALADVIRVRAIMGDLPREPTFAEAMTLIRQSLAQRPDFGAAYLQLGDIQHRHYWDFDGAADSYAKALELAPGSAAVHSAYSRFLSKIGAFDQAIDEAEIALDLDPKSAQAASSLAIRLVRAGHLDRARNVIDDLAATHPTAADLPWLNANWHVRNGTYRAALAAIALEELDYLRLSLSAIALYHLERTDQAREALDELIATDADGAAFQIAEVFAQWQQPDQAFAWLEKAYSQGDPGLAELHSSVNLDNLRQDPRFTELAARVGLPTATPP